MDVLLIFFCFEESPTSLYLVYPLCLLVSNMLGIHLPRHACILYIL